jgi:glycosyltransferase involved in cell wall biosynthesis
VTHPDAAAVEASVIRPPWISRELVAANARALRRDPRAYMGALWTAVRESRGNANLMAGAIVFFPKGVLLAELARRAGVGHLHAHFANHPATVAWVAHRLSGIPFSFTAHGSDLHRHQQMLELKARDAAFAFTVSDYNRRFVAERCGRATADRIELLRCGTDLDAFRPATRGLPNSAPFTILCIGALRAVKGHRVLIAACGLLRERGIDFRCHLVGDGPLAEELRRQVGRLGLVEHIVFEGALARPEVLARMAEADVAVLASVRDHRGRREGIPVVLIEAMACGLPVVASRISGIPELVEEGRSGLLFQPGDPVALARSLERLVGDPALREQLGRHGRLKVASDFDLRKNAGELARRIGGRPAPV